MRMHRLITPMLLVFSFCVPILGASQSHSKSEFWFLAPDNRPGAFLRGKAWNAKEVFSRAAVRSDEPQRRSNVQVIKPTDPFTTAFFAAQEDGKGPFLRDVEEAWKPVPKDRTADGPT